mgnify:CR=1 FL=1
MKINFSHKLLNFSFYIAAIFPLLPQDILGLPVILLIISSIINYFNFRENSFDYKKLIIATIPFFLFLVSSFYSDDFSDAFKKVSGTRLSLLVVPLSFFLFSNSSLIFLKSQLYKFQIVFSVTSFLLCLYYFAYLPFLEPPQNPHFAFPSGFFFKTATQKIPFFHLEPVYLSFLLVLSFINTTFLYVKNHLNLVYFIIVSIFYLSVIFLMSSKVAIVFTILFGTWFVFYILKKKKFRIVIMLLILFSLYPLSQIPSIKYEIEEIQYFLRGEKRAKDDSTQKRYLITVGALALANQVNPIIGTGIGDIKKNLNEIYIKKEYDELLPRSYGTHNQFLSMFIGTGIIGLIGLIIQLTSLITITIKRKLMFGFWVILFFSFQMLTEAILQRQVPVIIYSVFISLILFFPINNKNYERKN